MILCRAVRKAASSTATTIATAICPLYVFCGDQLLAAKLRTASRPPPAIIAGARFPMILPHASNYTQSV
jgi:hypothetical protein